LSNLSTPVVASNCDHRRLALTDAATRGSLLRVGREEGGLKWSHSTNSLEGWEELALATKKGSTRALSLDAEARVAGCGERGEVLGGGGLLS
jgi:hypothetical protein